MGMGITRIPWDGNRNECDWNGINIFTLTVSFHRFISNSQFLCVVYATNMIKNKNCGMKNVISYTSLLLL